LTSPRAAAVALALAAAVLLAGAVDAAAAVTRLRVDWQPADGSATMHPPYLFVDSAAGFSRYQGLCSGVSNCANSPQTRWVEESPDSGGSPRTISFVDDSAGQNTTFTFSASHPFAGFGPDITGTATITHADGRTAVVPFTLTPSSGARVPLGTSEGLVVAGQQPPPPTQGPPRRRRPRPGPQAGPQAQVLPAPTPGQNFNAVVVSGVVTFKCPGAPERPLEEATQLPVGCRLDARAGSVRITSAAGGGETQSAVFRGGIFKVIQRAGPRPVTDLRLAGPLERCPAAGRSSAAAAAAKRSGRSLWGSGKGRFRTTGRRSAATVTGTTWLVADRCDGSTLTRVTEGRVAVRDFVLRRTIRLRAGQSYVARPRRAASRR
jgi:hypothetical protein